MPPSPALTESTLKVLSVFARAGAGTEVYGLEVMNETGLASGTVYRILHKLMRAGWVESRVEQVDQVVAGRGVRTYYWLSDAGAGFVAGVIEALTPLSHDAGLKAFIAAREPGLTEAQVDAMVDAATLRGPRTGAERYLDERAANDPVYKQAHSEALDALASEAVTRSPDERMSHSSTVTGLNPPHSVETLLTLARLRSQDTPEPTDRIDMTDTTREEAQTMWREGYAVEASEAAELAEADMSAGFEALDTELDPGEEHAFYADPVNQTPQGPAVRRQTLDTTELAERMWPSDDPRFHDDNQPPITATDINNASLQAAAELWGGVINCPTCGTDVGIPGASCFNPDCANCGNPVRP